MPQEKRLETLSGLIHLGALSHGEALNPRARVGHETDESLGFQLSQGLSNRNPGATITLGKFFLDDAFAGSVLAREDRPPKPSAIRALADPSRVAGVSSDIPYSAGLVGFHITTSLSDS